MHTNEVRRVKVITSHVGSGSYLTAKRAGFIPRVPSIPSPYYSSPTHVLYYGRAGTAAAGRPCFVVETSHRRYEVFEVVSGEVFRREKDAIAAYSAERDAENEAQRVRDAAERYRRYGTAGPETP
jgi:hypothetical protein